MSNSRGWARMKRYRVRGSIHLEIDESDIEALTPAEAIEIAKDVAIHTYEQQVDLKAEEQ